MVAPKPPSPQQTTSSASGGKLCMMCTSEPVAVTFRPCGDQVACSQCSSRMKQCFKCHERIQEKVRIDISRSRTVVAVSSYSRPALHFSLNYGTHTHPFNGPLSGTTQVSRYQKGKTNNWILLKQETVSCSGISWAIWKFAPPSKQTTTPAPHHSVFTGRMSFLPPNQQRQSTEGIPNYRSQYINLTAHYSMLVRPELFFKLDRKSIIVKTEMS